MSDVTRREAMEQQQDKQEDRRRWWWLQETRPRRLAILVVCLVALGLMVALGLLSIQSPTLASDVWTTHELQEIAFPGVLGLLQGVSALGYLPWSLIVVPLGVLWVGWRFEWQSGAFLLALTLVQGGVNTVIKSLVGRPRPTDDLVHVFTTVSGQSFPSGHVMFYTTFFGFLFFLAWTRLAPSAGRLFLMALCAALVLLIGPSRMYLGAHWLSDVIAAYLVGVAILLPAIELYIARVAPSARRIAATAVEPEAPPQASSR